VTGGTDAIVEVGAELEGVLELPVGPVEAPLELAVDAPAAAGVGDTMATLEAGDEVVAVVEVVEDDPPDEDEDAEDEGLELSFGTALANGLRTMRASTTFVDSFFEVTFCVVAV
jgi:hypothetical protein